MEYVPGGELFDYLVRRGRLPPLEALHYFQQIIHAVDYCHRFNICHRDLKPENLLLDKDKNIKVADFGMAAWQSEERLLETSCGSPHYASPEIVAGRTYNGTASDIWSCGIILFALLTGRLPFDDDNIRTLLQKVKAGVFDMPTDIDPAAQDLLSRMLEKEPKERITMPEVMAHPFFTHHPLRLAGGRPMPTPLALGEMARPVRGEDIDEDIMGNMRTLWHGASEGEIYKSLMSQEKTWEKAIYHLLVKYRNRHLENYNMDAESDDDLEDDHRARPHSRPVAVKRNSSKHRRSGPPPAVVPSGQPSSVRRKPAPLAENDHVQNRGTPPPRPQAPTPKKAAMSVVTDSPVARTPSKLGPRSPAPVGPRSIRGTAPAPAIHLQEATPVKDLDANVERIQPPRSPLQASGALSPRSPALAESPNTLPLSPPRVENPQLQTFLFEIANQLNSISIRSSTASDNSNSSAIQSPEFQAYLQYMVNQSPTPEATPQLEKVLEVATASGANAATLQALEGGSSDQFADADDDETDADAASIYSPSIHSARRFPVPSPASSVRGAVSPAVGLGAPPRPPSRSGPPPVSGRWSYNSGSYRSRTHSSRPESPALHTPVSSFDHYTTPLPPVPGAALRAQRTAPPPPRASRPAPPRPAPAAEQRIESLLGREDSYAFIDGTEIDAGIADSWGSNSKHHSGFSSHRAADGFGMLRKRRNREAVAPSTPVDTSGGKRSWFNNLFSFKPAACEIYVNTPTISDGRKVTAKALTDRGVIVKHSEDANGIAFLKCKSPDMRDGGDTVKGVRFRVEFDRVPVNSSRSVFRTQVLLTLERGAHSTFKGVCNRLKTELESVPPSTPVSSIYPSIPTRNRVAQRPALFHNDGTLKVEPRNHHRPGSEPNTPVFDQSPFRHPHYQSQPGRTAPVRM